MPEIQLQTLPSCDNELLPGKNRENFSFTLLNSSLYVSLIVMLYRGSAEQLGS
jgi:hypothetical protein